MTDELSHEVPESHGDQVSGASVLTDHFAEVVHDAEAVVSDVVDDAERVAGEVASDGKAVEETVVPEAEHVAGEVAADVSDVETTVEADVHEIEDPAPAESPASVPAGEGDVSAASVASVDPSGDTPPADPSPEPSVEDGAAEEMPTVTVDHVVSCPVCAFKFKVADSRV